MKVTPPPRPRPGQSLPEMTRRLRAIEAVRARFEGRGYRPGRNDCAQMALSMMREMGHPGVPRTRPYSSSEAARRELARHGFCSLEQALDSKLERIAPAAMRPADLALVPADPDGALVDETIVVCLGHKFWGWHPDQHDLAVMDVDVGAIRAAWRV